MKRRTRPRGFIHRYDPRPETAALIRAGEAVLHEYARYLPLSCRQIYYRLVGIEVLEKTERAYKRLCEVLQLARRARIIRMESLRDDGIELPFSLEGYTDQGDLLTRLAQDVQYFRLDRQEGQPKRLLLWCEAAGMKPQLERVVARHDVHVLSSGGFD